MFWEYYAVVYGIVVCPANVVDVNQHLCEYKEINGDKNYLIISAVLNGIALVAVIIFLIVGIVSLVKFKPKPEYKLLE